MECLLCVVGGLYLRVSCVVVSSCDCVCVSLYSPPLALNHHLIIVISSLYIKYTNRLHFARRRVARRVSVSPMLLFKANLKRLANPANHVWSHHSSTMLR